MPTEEQLTHHLDNRSRFIATIVGEVFGPGSGFERADSLLADPTPYDLSQPAFFDTWDSYRKVRPVVAGTGEEILRGDRPTSRYGMGVLFPEEDADVRNEEQDTAAAEEAVSIAGAREENEGPADDELALRERMTKDEEAKARNLEKRAERLRRSTNTGSLDDEEVDAASDAADLRMTNLRKQRGIGVSLVVDTATVGDMVVHVTGGRYQRFSNVKVAEKKSHREITWWTRHRVSEEIRIPFEELARAQGLLEARRLEIQTDEGKPPLDLRLEVLVRGRERIPGGDHPDSARLITVTLVNRTRRRGQHSLDELCFFQARFAISAGEQGCKAILPYPASRAGIATPEQQSFNLLYRREQTFATGHGCAGAWEADEFSSHASCVRAEVIPSSETPSITPELEFKDPKIDKMREFKITLSLLADENRRNEACEQLRLMVDTYAGWIADQRNKVSGLDGRHQDVARRHLDACDAALKRMRSGILLLEKDATSNASIAFRLANQAMLMQALSSRMPTRQRHEDNEQQRVSYQPAYAAPNLTSDEAIDRAWRPFQIAFLLMNLTALADPSDTNRDIVDLIWFPTGGGKTEAYLACAAFSLFMRRLRNTEDVGTEVLMRYTLRLLTAQQFQRASSLICAMESIRKTMPDQLGTKSFRIGIWVGGDTTPNTIKDAKKSNNGARKHGEEDYKMILLKCPWCGAVMGPRKLLGPGSGWELAGVREAGQQVLLHCPDRKCPFMEKLPVEVIDEKIYNDPPDYIIATVDKFAGLAWRPECRSLFGLNDKGERAFSPPGLIIQDELHLITGPLGSMVGLYEFLVDNLSTDRRSPEQPIRPKLVAATATTRASDRQIRDLYARERTAIFPAPGLDADDSFFAKYDRDANGRRKPGRLYVGFLPINYSSSLTASVRLYAAALASAAAFKPEKDRDPWWTLLVFYNSLRELGANLTLFGADIPERLRDLQRRWFPAERRRSLYQLLELTGRLANSEVPRALESLGRPYVAKPEKGRYPVDACLASNIIEVGVDVERLGLMAVAGQPKTTAQYIQATGRVGRTLPGLILMHYGATKPRDRSHYEHFQAYHGRLYSQVEPASVTPFTVPTLERALHAVIIAFVRQTLPLDVSDRPSPFAGTILKEAAERGRLLLEQRIRAIAAEPHDRDRMLEDLAICYNKRIEEWERFRPVRWQEYFPRKDSGDQPLIRPYGSPCPATWEDNTWEAPNSLRGVDAECRLHIPHVTEAEPE